MYPAANELDERTRKQNIDAFPDSVKAKMPATSGHGVRRVSEGEAWFSKQANDCFFNSHD